MISYSAARKYSPYFNQSCMHTQSTLSYLLWERSSVGITDGGEHSRYQHSHTLI